MEHGENKTVANFIFLSRYKDANLKPAKITITVASGTPGSKITLVSEDRFAFFVHLECEKVRKFSDSSLLLFPNRKVVVTCDVSILASDLVVYQLGQVGQ
jgi:beta-mannosidase